MVLTYPPCYRPRTPPKLYKQKQLNHSPGIYFWSQYRLKMKKSSRNLPKACEKRSQSRSAEGAPKHYFQNIWEFKLYLNISFWKHRLSLLIKWAKFTQIAPLQRNCYLSYPCHWEDCNWLTFFVAICHASCTYQVNESTKWLGWNVWWEIFSK